MGPLAGLRVVEFEAIGPVPFGGMMLSDMGADVLVIDRKSDSGLGLPRERWNDVMMRGRRSVMLDLKQPGAVEAALRVAAKADVLLEGFRPGVMERLGLGPDAVFARNPRIVYGRMTGWGQTGPLAKAVGHDIDYIAMSGVLNAIGRAGDPPTPPLNLVGDFGGGGMLLAFGVACGVIEARQSGRGQVVDAAMIDGASSLAAMFHGMLASQRWSETRAANVLDSGAPWYDTYRTRDDRYIAIGAIEPQFYAALLRGLGLDGDPSLPDQHDRTRWPELRRRIAEVVASRTSDEWIAVFDGTDACVAPVLSFSEARAHPHARARDAFIDLGGVSQPAPAPRFGRTPGRAGSPPPERGEGGRAALADWGFDSAAVAELTALGMAFAG
jgi:alpha-methylacyl-CoA racemase